MLTALDFKDEVLYSRDAIWVRDDGAGSARIGLASYALFGEATDVYFVKLPKGGATLVKGEPFGHVDLGSRTVPLVAPVSGTVLFPNTALRDDPMLLVNDPFERGFLLELDGVERADTDELYDRDDAVLFFGRFGGEAEAAGLEAEQTFELGRPWATTTTLRVEGRTVATARILPPNANEVFTPDWVCGDAWTVEARLGGPTGPTRRFRFEVLGDGQVAQEEVTRVKAIELPAPGEPGPKFYRILHFRFDDHTLAAWDEVAAGDPLAVRRFYNPRGREAWIETRGAADGFILDHPKFPVSLDDEARDIPEGPVPSGAEGRSKGEPGMSHYVKFRGGLTRIEAEMRTDVPREDGRGTEVLLSVFRYERGAPWWTEATRMLGDKELVRAKLQPA